MGAPPQGGAHVGGGPGVLALTPSYAPDLFKEHLLNFMVTHNI